MSQTAAAQKLPRNVEFIGAYIQAINGGITATFKLYNDGHYHRAVDALIPLLCYMIPETKEKQERVDNLITRIDSIPESAEKRLTGYGKNELEYRRQALQETLSRGLYREAVREIRDVIRDTILISRKRDSSGIGFSDDDDEAEGWIEV